MGTRSEIAKEQIIGYVIRNAIATCLVILVFVFVTCWIGVRWRTFGLILMWLDVIAASFQGLKLLVGSGADIFLGVMEKFWPDDVAAVKLRHGDETRKLRFALLIRVVELAFSVGSIYYLWRFFYP